MRNLKRALSLALASVMLMSMMVVGTGASFTDTDSYDNTQAVEVMAALGVLNGYEDGTFQGENVVTRAEMAKIVVCMAKGSDYSVSKFAGLSGLSDVDGHWADGYISAGVALGLIKGNDDGSYKPEEAVSTVEAAIILARVVGYFKNAEDEGSAWALNGMVVAEDIGIMGDLDLAATAGLTRDNLAQMMYNAMMNAEYVAYSSDADEYTEKLTDANSTYTMADEVFGLEYTVVMTEDALARPMKAYTSSKLDDPIYVAIDADYTFVGANDFTDDIDAEVDADTYLSDGSKYGTTYNGLYTTDMVDGDVVEIYLYTYSTDKTGAYVVAYSYATGEVTNVAYVEDDDETTVTVNGYTYVIEGESDKFAKEDVVVYAVNGRTAANKTTDYMEIAVESTGTVGSYSGTADTVTIDGTVYTHVSGISVGAEDLGEEATFILDPNGYVIDFDTDGTAEAANYLLVEAEGSNVVVGNAIDGYRVSAIFADGTAAVITIDSIDGTADSISSSSSITVDTVFTYSEDDGVYTLDDVTKDAAALAVAGTQSGFEAATTVDITSGAYKMTGATNTNTNADTVFVDIDAGVAYTGFEAVPTYDDADAFIVYEDTFVEANTRVIAVVFIDGTADTTDDESVYAYIADAEYTASKSADDTTVYTYTAYVDGVKTEISVEYDGTGVDTIADETLVKFTDFAEDGYATKAEVTTYYNTDVETVTIVATSNFWADDYSSTENTWYVDEDTAYVIIDDDGTDVSVYAGSYSDIEADAKIVVAQSTTSDSKEYIDLVFIYVDTVPGSAT